MPQFDCRPKTDNVWSLNFFYFYYNPLISLVSSSPDHYHENYGKISFQSHQIVIKPNYFITGLVTYALRPLALLCQPPTSKSLKRVLHMHNLVYPDFKQVKPVTNLFCSHKVPVSRRCAHKMSADAAECNEYRLAHLTRFL